MDQGGIALLVVEEADRLLSQGPGVPGKETVPVRLKGFGGGLHMGGGGHTANIYVTPAGPGEGPEPQGKMPLLVQGVIAQLSDIAGGGEELAVAVQDDSPVLAAVP